MRKTCLAVSILAVSLALAAPAARAQEGTISWVYLYNVERGGRTSELVDLITTHFGSAIQEQAAAGNVIGWGIAERATNQQDGYTHLEWINFPSWSAAATATKAFDADYEALAKAHKDGVRRGFKGLLEQRENVRLAQAVVREVPEDGEAPEYLVMGEWTARPGMESRLTQLYVDVAEPRYQELLANGQISAYGLATPVLHDPEWTHWSWYSGSDLAAVGAVAGAFLSSQELDESLAELTDRTKHRDTIYRVVHLLGQEN